MTTPRAHPKIWEGCQPPTRRIDAFACKGTQKCKSDTRWWWGKAWIVGARKWASDTRKAFLLHKISLDRLLSSAMQAFSFANTRRAKNGLCTLWRRAIDGPFAIM